MKILKNILKLLFAFLVVLNIVIWVTGNTHIYKGLTDTYFQGRLKPTIDDPDIFYNRVMHAKNTKPWKESVEYNLKPLSKQVSNSHKVFGTKAFLVIEGDEIIHETYYDDYSKEKISNSFSMAKSVLAAIVGIAVKEGEISINESVHNLLPNFINKKDKDLKIRHLLSNTSGMNFRESYGNPIGFMAKAYYGTDLKSLTEGFELEKKPGVEYSYLGGNSLLLGFLLEKVTKEKVAHYGSRMLWEKLGMENDAKWILDHEDGDEKTFSGIYATARDFSKIGKLYMNYGMMYGEQIIDSSFVAESIKPLNVLDRDGENTNYYGYSWWITKYKGHKVFYMRGILGQYVICVPDKSLIITRLGQHRSPNMTKKDNVPDDVWSYLEEGFRLIE
jgi:CubicO group peptidase (beta-lactamase class C family)